MPGHHHKHHLSDPNNQEVAPGVVVLSKETMMDFDRLTNELTEERHKIHEMKEHDKELQDKINAAGDTLSPTAAVEFAKDIKEDQQIEEAISTEYKVLHDLEGQRDKVLQLNHTDSKLVQTARLVVANPLSKRTESLRASLQSFDQQVSLIRDLESLYKDEADEEIKSLAKEDLENALSHSATLETSLLDLVVTSDESDQLGALLEVKAGVGGTEAAVFAADLVRSYTKWSARKGWKTVMLDSSSVLGSGEAFRQALIEITGHGAYGLFKHEIGVHRVQRIPSNDTAGRMHTSTAAVFPSSPPNTGKENLFDQKDVKEEVMRSGGAGGQHVNKTESAVRLTHLPTGITVSMQDSRSQQQNRVKAYTVLRARLLDAKLQAEQDAKRTLRKKQVKTNDRSDKIKTYNYPQDRVTDHRLPLTINNIEDIMSGGPTNDIFTAALEQRQVDERLDDLLDELQPNS